MGKLLDPRRVALVIASAIALLALLGAVYAWEPRPALARFDLDEERTVPALFTACLLLASAVLAARLPRSLVSRIVALALAAILVFAAIDEFLEIHETLERRSGVDWQVLYVPVALVAAIVLALVVRAFRRAGERLVLLLASGACLLAAQIFEALQWEDDGPARGYTVMMVAEETLELAGSALLLLALLVATRR